MKRVLLAAAAVCAACGGTSTQASQAPSPSVSTPAAPDPKLTIHVYGNGRVLSAPGGLECRNDCSATFAPGTMVVLTAAADAGNLFSGFGGACSNVSCVLILSGDAQVSASFAARPPVPQRFFTVAVDVAGTGAGKLTSTPAGIDCAKGHCSASFREGTRVSFSAVPDPLSKTTFGGDCSGSSCALTVTRDAAVHVAFDQVHYKAVDFGVLDGGWWSNAGTITRHSRLVVGGWGGSAPRAFLWDGASMSDFNFGFAALSVVSYADGGLVAGNYATTWPGTFIPFVVKDGVLRELELLPGGSNGMAAKMNSHGTVVGYVNIGIGAGCRAVMWRDTKAIDLGTLEAGITVASAWGVNNSDVAVGLASAPHVPGYEAVIFRGNGVIEELGTLGGIRAQANGINNHGVAVGVSDVNPDSYDTHGFFAVDGKLVDIGTVPGLTNSYLANVNDAGVAVGAVGMDPMVGWRGIVATRDRMVELTGLVDNLSETVNMASDIDEAGDIVATVGNMRAMLLVPQR